MPKNVFRQGEVEILDSILEIESPVISESSIAELEEIPDAEEYTGPTAEDIRREAENFRTQWEEERERMESDARERSEGIISDAEKQAAEILNEHRSIIEGEREAVKEESEKTRSNAQAEAERIIAEAKAEVEAIQEEARQKGHAEGLDRGYESGQAEVHRLIERLHLIINKAITQRTELMEKSESQIVQLVLSIARKVVRAIGEKQRTVVVNNTLLALKKLKTRTDVVIRVNLADLDMASKHKKDFIEQVEMVKSLSVLEDSSVDPGGVIIESDYGQIDARIQSQFREVERAVNEISPISEK